MTAFWTHQYTATRVTAGPSGAATRITVTAGLEKLDGNPRPYFSVTCDIEEQARNNRWVTAGGGAAHDEILKRFPRLAPVVALHLSDDLGTPMHAVENALYFAGTWPVYDARNLDTLAKHLRITPEQAAALAADCDRARESEGTGEEDDTPTERARLVMTAFVETQAERWLDEARAAIIRLDDLIAEESPVSSPK